MDKEEFTTETQFLQTTIDRLNIDTYAWSEMSERDRERTIAELKRRRPHVIVQNP